MATLRNSNLDGQVILRQLLQCLSVQIEPGLIGVIKPALLFVGVGENSDIDRRTRQATLESVH